MTKNDAKKEVAKLNAKQNEIAKKLREQASRNSAAQADGTAFEYEPTYNVEPVVIETQIPGFEKLEGFKVTFRGESKTFQKSGDAKAWGKAQRKAYKDANGSSYAKRILTLRLTHAADRVLAVADSAESFGNKELSALLEEAGRKLEAALDMLTAKTE